MCIRDRSTGIQDYIDRVQEDTLSSYPISIEAETMDMSSMVTSLMGAKAESEETEHEDGRVYSSTIMYDLMHSLNAADTQTKDLKSFRAYLDDPDSPIHEYLSAIQYSYCLLYTSFSRCASIFADVRSLMATTS